ncbi:diguanylate cyclase (GGDEF) domain-containing protein [Ferrimonas sediminum]|uniref:diguanylate cyclase n=1 Tax=Ferrimonas sediminum TaxID=718193 RepID=A0A1G8M861_9GAMM|nr:GGDEF domain-containing protein [Ferrimonas sediminum]SDI64111.1 diguanylate cyclase (GGDEF) domain-containing protein [Ferrimonas sediminum]
MDTHFFWFGNLMVLLGIALLAAATIKVTALLKRLPNRELHYHWQFLRVLILMFIFGYAGFSLLHWGNYHDGSSMIVPTIFFGGALFVLWVCTLSLRTTKVVQTVYHLQKEAITDPLMKIFNRRYLDRRLQEEVLICRTGNRPLTLMMLDIDHFKLVNDRYGHPVGDEVLKALGQLLMRHTRHADVVARYGGEEVVVLLPNTCGNEAHVLARRLHQEVAQLTVPLPELNRPPRPPLTFSVCIGVAGCNASNADANQLLAAADMALYQAKQNGRNRVECCPDLRLAANTS